MANLLLEQIFERVLRIAGIARWGRVDPRHPRPGTVAIRAWSGRVASDREARREQSAFVLLILHRDPNRDRLLALKTGRGLKMGALLAAMQLRRQAVP